MCELDGKLFPAVPTLFNKKTGSIDIQANKDFAMYLRETPIDGVAVWVHTGRGLFLSREERHFILKLWREALPEKTIFAGVGSKRKELNYEDIKIYIEELLMMAEEAKSGGADCLLAFPPVPLKKLSEDDDLIVRYHRELEQIGLPVILFYLYEEAGGLSYSYETLEKLLSMDHVVGIKLATLYSVIKMQDISRFVLERFPDKALITGEDRMFGYSLTRGSRSALIGLGSVLPQLTKRVDRKLPKKRSCFYFYHEKGRPFG